jgi:phosphatidylserine decarboxylase
VPVAAEAVPFLLGLGGVAILLGFVVDPLAGLAFLPLTGFVLYFFRDPDRVVPQDAGLIVAPADGRVTAVETVPGGARISIFLSVFDVHINRSPVSGTVRRRQYTPGRFLPAWDPRVAAENERNHLEIEAPDGTYGVTQIAGILARRIVCRKAEGDRVGRGERIGLIRFGSRTDLHLPPGVAPLVRVGDRVRGGVTIMAKPVAQAATGAARTAAAARP